VDVDIIERLEGVAFEAMKDRSRHVADCCLAAIVEIKSLRAARSVAPMGCVCPADATSTCANQFCPRKAIPNIMRS
jgi:hypothetical protein